MTAYEFIKKDDHYDYTPQGFNRYDMNQIAGEIGWRTRGPNFDTEAIRTHKEYEEAQNLYYEFTMSCNREEAMFWLKHWMDKAWAWKLRLREWEEYFYAAYDIYKSLEKGD